MKSNHPFVAPWSRQSVFCVAHTAASAEASQQAPYCVSHPRLADYGTTVLRVLETHGGDGALALIKKGVLTYVSKDFGSAASD